MTPLDTYKLAASVLEAIQNNRLLLPDEAAWVSEGLTALLDGRDIREGFHLKQSHGKRAEKGVKLARRDDCIRKLATGNSPKQVARFVSGEDPAPEHLAELVATIRDAGPVGERQVVRIVSSQPKQETQTLNRLLCLWS